MDRKALGEELLALLADLIAIPSTYPPGDSSRIAAHCRDFLAPLGFSTEIISKTKGVDNVVARQGSGKPSLVFNAHADTVGVGERAAWRTDPFKATLKDGRVYGLGAANCKASMAVHLWLAREIAKSGRAPRGEVVFTFVGDEENLGPDGMAYLRGKGTVKPTTLIVAAPTLNRLVTEERGVMWVRATARGKAAHAGAPHTGDSAILRMHGVISALQREFVAKESKGGQRSTLSIGRIRGGENINVVPDLCTIEMDRRMLPNEDMGEVYAGLKAICERAGAVEVELLTGTPGFSAPENGAGVKAFSESIQALTGRPAQRLNVVGASDGRYFAKDGIEILVTGPGDGADSHIPNEFVELEQVIDAALIHRGAARCLLG